MANTRRSSADTAPNDLILFIYLIVVRNTGERKVRF